MGTKKPPEGGFVVVSGGYQLDPVRLDVTTAG
jgi:hypothetical protein